jgi:hypothetical protein
MFDLKQELNIPALPPIVALAKILFCVAKGNEVILYFWSKLAKGKVKKAQSLCV